MIKTKNFYDLCIQDTFFNDKDLEKKLGVLYDYGYRTIACNQSVDDGNLESKKKKKGEARNSTQAVVPIPLDLKKLEKLGYDDFKVLNRLTITFTNQDILHKIIKSPNYKKYHLVAIRPMTAQALAHTCSTLEADIITFDLASKFNLKLNRKTYNQLIVKGCYFELQYAPAILDSSMRKNLVHMSHAFHMFGKSKNIIISSGAERLDLLRGPYDIVNLAVILGMSELQCKSAITHCCKKVIVNSVGRRHQKAVMFVEVLEKSNESVQVISDAEMEEVSDEDEEMEQRNFKKSKT